MEVKDDSDQENGPLWNNLTEVQKQEVLLSFEENFDESNLIRQPHSITAKTIADALERRRLGEPITNIIEFVNSL